MTYLWLPGNLRGPLLNQGGFSPAEISKIKRWYRLAASTPVSSEYQTVAEVLGGTSISQTDADRKPAAATSTNNLPVATFDGSDIWLQTLETGNNSTAKWFLALRVKPADFGAAQQLYSAMTTAGASVNRGRVGITGGTGTVGFDIFVSGFNGRNYLTAGSLTSAAWNHIYVIFDGSKTNECDTTGSDTDAKVRIAFGTTFQAITASDQGTGGLPSALLSATGTACLFAATDSDTPVVPLRNGGQVGPNMFFGDDSLSAAELAALVGFEAPT